MTFDPTKPVQLEDGSKAGIYATDGGNPWPIHGWYEESDGRKFCTSWTKRGASGNTDSSHDLINIPEAKHEPVLTPEMKAFLKCVVRIWTCSALAPDFFFEHQNAIEQIKAIIGD